MELNMKTFGVLMLLALTAVGAMAADSPPPPAPPAESEAPGFADGWRLSGILKQGGKLQASVEHASRTPRFVVEGGELVVGVRVEKIDPVTRSITVRKGNLIAIIHSGSSPVVVKSSPMVAQGAPQPSGPQPAAPDPQQPQRPTPTAAQDANGRWGIQLSDGRFISTEDYAARFGGVDQAVARLNSRLASDLPPERKAFAQQMLTALQNAQLNQPQASYGGSAATSSANTPVYSAGGAVSTAPAATVAPQVMESSEAGMTPEDLGSFQTPVRVYRRGPQLNR